MNVELLELIQYSWKCKTMYFKIVKNSLAISLKVKDINCTIKFNVKKNVKHTLVWYNPVILESIIYSRKMKACTHTYKKRLTVVLFISEKKLAISKYPCSKSWHNHAMEYYLLSNKKQ